MMERKGFGIKKGGKQDWEMGIWGEEGVIRYWMEQIQDWESLGDLGWDWRGFTKLSLLKGILSTKS